MAKKIKGDQIFTGQLLREGLVVYFTADENWSTDLQQAVVATSDDELTELEMKIESISHKNDVIDVYPFVVVRDEKGKLVPQHIRERIRTEGPSIDYINQPFKQNMNAA